MLLFAKISRRPLSAAQKKKPSTKDLKIRRLTQITVVEYFNLPS